LALERIGNTQVQLQTIDAGLSVELPGGWRVDAIPAAHETVEFDVQGQCQWLGYVITTPSASRIYHSGDCIPYEGLAEKLQQLRPDLALLPVNGRDEERSGHGVPGNFHLHEAVELCRVARIPSCLAHHHGMFAFNTVEPQFIDTVSAEAAHHALLLVRAQLGVRYVLGQ
jgi:L-ascorbate metabolism protein UlaG (beta-lactamase superfamily)